MPSNTAFPDLIFRAATIFWNVAGFPDEASCVRKLL
jgi:hypothetical protein